MRRGKASLVKMKGGGEVEKGNGGRDGGAGEQRGRRTRSREESD